LKKLSILALLFGLSMQSVSFSAAEKFDGIIAVIGEEVVLRSELDAYTLMRLNGLNIQPDSSKMLQYKKDFLNELIEGKVLLAHAKQDTTIQVSNQDVENALRNHINGILQQNNIPQDSLESVLIHQQGMTLAKFKSESRRAIREQIYKQRLQQMFLSTIKVNKKDVVDFYAQYKDSLPKAGESVLLSKLSLKISTSEKVRQAAFDKINLIKKKIENGEDFAELAKKYSESPDAVEGGDLGFITKGSLGEIAFEEKAFSLLPGQVSEMIETHLGFHLIKALEKKDQRIHIRQIFIKVAPAEQQIQNIMSQLDSIRVNCKLQADFVLKVNKMSDDNLTKSRNGSMGWISTAELPGNIRNAIDSFPSGTITQPIREDNVISVYRIDDRVTSRTLSLENDYGILSEKTRDILAQKKLLELVNQWRQEVYIEIKGLM
jgi:peptidyl-prolyl cis-trans isomerase SurA